MTCAKRKVICVLSDNSGERTAIGTNECFEPQERCPRLPGEDYTKCRTICDQPWHAEEHALWNWRRAHGEHKPTHALVRGHTHACGACEFLLINAGVKRITFGEPIIE